MTKAVVRPACGYRAFSLTAISAGRFPNQCFSFRRRKFIRPGMPSWICRETFVPSRFAAGEVCSPLSPIASRLSRSDRLAHLIP
jgi:hypothetical protein